MTLAEWRRDENNEVLKSESTLPSLKGAKRHRDRAIEALRRLTDDQLVELWRIAEEATGSDGYPQSDLGTGVRSQAELTSVESAAEARVFNREVRDPILAGVEALADGLLKVSGIMCDRDGGLERIRQHVMSRGDALRGRQATDAQCAACDRWVAGTAGERLKNSLCWRSNADPESNEVGGCYDAWLRYRSRVQRETGQAADPVKFEAERREQIGLPPRKHRGRDEGRTDVPYVR